MELAAAYGESDAGMNSARAELRLDDCCLLSVPGRHGTDAAPWLAQWERHGDLQRVEQHDGDRPLRGDWIIQLEEAVLGTDRPVLAVAHGLGCMAVAAWARHSHHTALLRGAVLLWPDDCSSATGSRWWWHADVWQALPFPSLLVADGGKPGGLDGSAMAAAWGSEWIAFAAAGSAGGVTATPDWEQGRRWLQRVLAAAATNRKHTHGDQTQ